MFILTFFLVVAISQFIGNKIMGISSESEESYSYSKKESIFIAILFFIGILLQIFINKLSFLNNIYWWICLLYLTLSLILMLILMVSKKDKIEKQREEIKSVYEILQKLVDRKGEGLDYNNVPFTLGYKYGAINQINVTVDPTSFDDKILSILLQQLNSFLPTFTWNYELHLEERYITFVGNDKPPTIARWPGSWLRPLNTFPIGISGTGELCWQPDSVDKSSLGRSLFLNEHNEPINIDISLSRAPQGLVAGGPLALDTIIPTTKGYKTMKTIDVGDYVFDLYNKPTKVLGVYKYHKSNKLFKLVFKDEYDNLEVVIADDIHRFPVVFQSKLDFVITKQLNINDKVIGNNSTYTLIKKNIIDNNYVKCITTASDEHLFLITSKINSSWKGGNTYPFNGIYTANTGGGKAIWIEQEIID